MMTKKKDSAEKAIRDIRRATRRRYSAEEKIRIVLEGLRGESSIAELCRKEGINQNLYYRWSKEFLEAGKKRLAGDTAREANGDEVRELRSEAAQLKEALAETLLENRLLKKAPTGLGATIREVQGVREARDHRSGGELCAVSTANARSAGHPEVDLLRLVRTLP
jgi:transposase